MVFLYFPESECYMKFMTTRFYKLLFLFFSIFLTAGNAHCETMLTLTRMEIPRLELDIEVRKIPFSREQKTWDITEETGAVYWLEGTSHPEYGGNTVLAAHYMESGEPGPLFRVRDLEEGDEIILYSENTKYTYKVDRYQYVPDTYVEFMKSRPYALTLFTCSGFNWDTGVWEQRVIVLATLFQIDFIG